MSSPCAIAKKNTCQSKNSGGHPGSILSIGTRFCAKKTKIQEKREREFYEKVWQRNSVYSWFRSFIPRYKGMCQHNSNLYSVMENLKAGLKNPRELDIKLGKKTASHQELLMHESKFGAVFKKNRHNLLDRFTTSSAHGFRVEGVSGWKGSKFELMRAPHEKVWLLFFPSALIIRKVLKKLGAIIAIVENHQDDLYLVGSSVLILHDGQKVVVKLIDFAHSQIGDITYNQEQHRKIMTRYLDGLKSLYQSLARFA